MVKALMFMLFMYDAVPLDKSYLTFCAFLLIFPGLRDDEYRLPLVDRVKTCLLFEIAHVFKFDYSSWRRIEILNLSNAGILS
jgi:hypothetical protein